MREAWQRLRQKRGAVLALAMGNLICALLATAPLSPSLARALDFRPAAVTVADGADDAPRTELLEDRPELVATFGEGALVAVLLWGVLSWIAAGGLLSDEPFLIGCARHARRLATVGAVGLPLRLLALTGPLLAWPIVDAAHDFPTALAGLVLGVVTGGLMWSMVTVTLDRARGKALARPELRAWPVVRAALATSRARLGNTFILALLSALGFVLVTTTQLGATHWLPATPLSTAVALLAAVLGALGRAGLSALILFASQDRRQ